jgi:hypothetical protein
MDLAAGVMIKHKRTIVNSLLTDTMLYPIQHRSTRLKFNPRNTRAVYAFYGIPKTNNIL